ncbi:hypothetical protein BX666DRAFT_1902523 [Dichotomocladium elegans]|nr:hypothetical protein BX666DRAFT_1902523 [Dichotomocladium elegans]
MQRSFCIFERNLFRASNSLMRIVADSITSPDTGLISAARFRFTRYLFYPALSATTLMQLSHG